VLTFATTGLPLGLQVAAWIFAAILFIGACLGGYYLLKGKKAAANQSLADSAVTSLSGELAASNSRIDRLEADNSRLKESLVERDHTIEEQSKRIDILQELVNSRDLIIALDKKVDALLARSN